jgi:hypothetical protein
MVVTIDAVPTVLCSRLWKLDVGFQARAALCTITTQSTSAPLQEAPLVKNLASHDGAS